MLEDTELLRRYAESRSEEAFAELVQRRIGLVYSVALRRTRSPQRAEDVAQTVFADLARKAAVLSRRPALAGWLYRSAHFAAATLMRGERNRMVRETEAQLMHEITRDDDSEQDWEKTRPLLDEVLSELDERDRDALLLRFFDDRTFAEIGRRLELTENAARMRVERALDKFHALLARRGVKSTSAALGMVLAQQAVAATSAPVGLAAAVTGTALLAGGSAASAPSAGLIYFMSAQKIAAGIAGAVLAAGLGVAISVARFEPESPTSVNAIEAADLHALQRRADEAEQTAEERQKLLVEKRAAQAARNARAVEELKASRAVQLAEGNAFVARHPEVRALAIKNSRMTNAGIYAQLFKMLGLSPEQIERFLDLSVQGTIGRLRKSDGNYISYELGGNASEAKRQLRELLGEEGYRFFGENSERVSSLATVNQVAGALYRTSAPLTAEQGEHLFRILMEGRVAVDGSKNLQYDWGAITARAQPILSPPQWEALSHQRAQDEFQQAYLRMRTEVNQPAAGAKVLP